MFDICVPLKQPHIEHYMLHYFSHNEKKILPFAILSSTNALNTIFCIFFRVAKEIFWHFTLLLTICKESVCPCARVPGRPPKAFNLFAYLAKRKLRACARVPGLPRKKKPAKKKKKKKNWREALGNIVHQLFFPNVRPHITHTLLTEYFPFGPKGYPHQTPTICHENEGLCILIVICDENWKLTRFDCYLRRKWKFDAFWLLFAMEMKSCAFWLLFAMKMKNCAFWLLFAMKMKICAVLIAICDENDDLCVLTAICDENEALYVLIAICDEN